MRIKLENGAFPPIREHETDAGLDIRSRDSKSIYPGESAVFHTGVHIQLPKGTAGILVSKSGMNIGYGLTSTGLIDEGYTGEIVVKLFNHGWERYRVNKGDKITQLIIVPVLYEPVEIVDKISGGERGENGFGSTGR